MAVPGRLEEEMLFRLLDSKESLHRKDEAVANLPSA